MEMIYFVVKSCQPVLDFIFLLLSAKNCFHGFLKGYEKW